VNSRIPLRRNTAAAVQPSSKRVDPPPRSAYPPSPSAAHCLSSSLACAANVWRMLALLTSGQPLGKTLTRKWACGSLVQPHQRLDKSAPELLQRRLPPPHEPGALHARGADGGSVPALTPPPARGWRLALRMAAGGETRNQEPTTNLPGPDKSPALPGASQRDPGRTTGTAYHLRPRISVSLKARASNVEVDEARSGRGIPVAES